MRTVCCDAQLGSGMLHGLFFRVAITQHHHRAVFGVQRLRQARCFGIRWDDLAGVRMVCGNNHQGVAVFLRELKCLLHCFVQIDRLANLYVVFCITVVTVVLLFMFARSRYGRAVKAIRDDEIAAGASGINITYMKVLVFAISAFFAGIAGGIFAQYIGALTPSMAGWLQSINYVIMVVFGGMGSLTGSIVAAVGLTILPELLRAFSAYRMLVYSVVLVIIMVFRPQGLFGNWEFSLPKFVNKWFYPVRVKMHGKSGASQSASKKTKETGETTASSEINTSSEDKEVQA